LRSDSLKPPANPYIVEQMNDIDNKHEPAIAEAAAWVKRRGPEVIGDFVRRLPGRPGVYRMIDDKGDVIYVGKARSLKNRVQSYVRMGGHTNRIAAMIALTANMEFVTTRTEAEALLLEANLIKKFKPRFNVTLRDDKSFPYILLATQHEFAQLMKHRGARTKVGSYYGPFASAGAVNRTINALQKAFLLRSCSDAVFENRTRPCLLFQIKRCSAPCTGEIAKPAYEVLLGEAKAFLEGKSRTVKAELAKAMQEASDHLDYEQAARYRDRIAALSFVTSVQGINPETVDEADVFALAQQGGQTCVQVFFFRCGQNWGNRAYFPRADKTLGSGEVMAAFLAQFYDDKPLPPLILLSHAIDEQELLSEAFSIRAGRKVEILVPKRGEKHTLVSYAESNAREAMARNLAETQSQKKTLEAVGRFFGLDVTPRRIEVFDNSHIQGAQPIGVMIVAGPSGFLKAHYRKFNLRSEAGAAGDDFGMMRELLTRRFSRLLKEEGEAPASHDDEIPRRPDLVLIDGGQGQVSAAKSVLEDLGLGELPIAGVAKGPDRNSGREHIYTPGKPSAMLDSRDPVLYYIQRLRDEAHRFAVTGHRARRSKTISANPLNEIAGIGPGRKRALLMAFGSAKAVGRASIADLEKVEGISRPLATAIYEFFHEGME
jgi:excinuclease ABC subunit C